MKEPEADAAPVVAVELTPEGLILQVNGVVQSILPNNLEELRGYWPAMLPDRAPEHALILGLGCGTLVHLLRHRFGSLQITGIDDDERVLSIGREAFGLTEELVTAIHADAASYLGSCRERYDLVLVDLFRGESLPAELMSRAFPSFLCSVLTPGGRLVWNIHRDRRGAVLRRRMQRRLRPERTVVTGLNLILHLRRHRYRLRP
ncbi:MAG: spermidine synthase [Dehalococcoidia bacterium]